MIYPVFGKLNVSFPLKILGLDILVLSSYRVCLYIVILVLESSNLSDSK